MKKGSSPFRFVTTRTRGEYGVHRGDDPIGFITKVVHRIGRKTIHSGWTPSTPGGTVLAIEPTQEAAARALWRIFQEFGPS